MFKKRNCLNCTYLCYSPSGGNQENDYVQPKNNQRNEEYLLNLKCKKENSKYQHSNEYVKCYLDFWDFSIHSYGGLSEILEEDNTRSSDEIVRDNKNERKEILTRNRKKKECPFVRYESNNPNYQSFAGNLNFLEFKLSKMEQSRTRWISRISILISIISVGINFLGLFLNSKGE